MEYHLGLEVAQYKAAAWATNTQKAYSTHRRTYLKFCALLRCPPVPAGDRLVCLYAAWLARRLAYKSVKIYLNIISLIHKEMGLPSPIMGNFHVQQTLRGIRRVKGDRPRPKAPITPDLLLHIRARLDFGCQKHVAVWAACLTMFVGILRRSNVMPPSVAGFSSARHLCVGDISLTQEGYQLIIKWSKTIQFKQEPVKVFIPRRRGHPLCPVRALFLALERAPRDPDSPALGYQYDGSFRPLTPVVFLEVLREALGAGGVDPGDYAGHSFRRGGATWLHRCGASTDLIKIMGGWASDCYQKYLSPGNGQKAEAAALMINSLPG